MPDFGLRAIIVLLVGAAIGMAITVGIERRGREEQLVGGSVHPLTTVEPAAPTAAHGANDGYADSTAKGKVAAIYYGWLIDEHGQPNTAAQRLAAGQPEMIIAAGYTDQPRRNNLPSAVRVLFHNAHTRIAVYIPTDFGRRPLKQVQFEVTELAEDVDGIFLDEVAPNFDPPTWTYYVTIAAQIRAAGKLVIANPGVAAIDERMMDIADIVMLEHQWAQFTSETGWRVKYPPDRFMGVSSNEPHAARELGHKLDARQAEADTKRAWAAGIGWHYSCSRYTQVPSWYIAYMRAVRA